MTVLYVSLAFLTLWGSQLNNGKASAIRPTSPDSTTAAAAAHATGGAAPVPLLKRRAVDALLQADASQGGTVAQKQTAEDEQHSKHNGPYPAGWFGDFSQGESTYTYDGLFANRDVNTQINVLDGWNPQEKNPFTKRSVPSAWFEESQSGGDKAAWQTFYPAARTGIAGNNMPTGEWYTGTGGIWQQNYQSPHIGQTGLLASWFDNSVNQIDGFGREKFPALGSPRNYVYWEERSVNTTLTCSTPGCVANVSLQAPFDSNTEVSKDCMLSVMFHPTDFGDQYSGEGVQWVQVNNRLISSNCRPFAEGCNQSASRPLLPCADAVPIDLLMPENGVLEVAAKIADVVDECPYNGNLLSAVPLLTCLVAPSSMAKLGEVAPVKPSSSSLLGDTCVATMPLQCPTRGCAAEIAIPIKSMCGAAFNQCTLSITVNQTDYDNKEGVPEMIEYIKVAGKHVKSNLKPGQNPCKSAWSGSPVRPSALAYTALKDYDVSTHARSGSILIEGKISQYVDECASNGYLLDAMAKVTCSAAGGPKTVSLLSRNHR